MHRFEVRYRIPGGGYASLVVAGNSSSDATAAVQAMCPGAEISWIRQLD